MRTIDQLVVRSLMVPFTVVMHYEIRERPMKMPFTKRNDLIEAFFFDQTNESFPYCPKTRMLVLQSKRLSGRAAERPA